MTTALSTTSLATNSFDYKEAKLPADVVKKLKSHAKGAQQQTASTLKAAIESGKHFLASRDLFGGEETGRMSQFYDWVQRDCGTKKRTAQRCMQVAEVFGGVADKYYTNFTLNAALQICGDDVTDDVLKSALKRIDKEKCVIDTTVLKELISSDSDDSDDTKVTDDNVDSKLSKPALETLEEHGHKLPKNLKKKLAAYSKSDQQALAKSVANGEQTINKAVSDGIIPELTLEEQMELSKKKLNQYVTQIRNAVKAKPINIPALDAVEDTIKSQMSALASTIRSCKPHAICPACEGIGCAKCNQAGWVTEEIHETLVGKPEE